MQERIRAVAQTRRGATLCEGLLSENRSDGVPQSAGKGEEMKNDRSETLKLVWTSSSLRVYHSFLEYSPDE